MDLNLTPREQEVIRTAEAFTREMIVPNAAGWEQELIQGNDGTEIVGGCLRTILGLERAPDIVFAAFDTVALHFSAQRDHSLPRKN